MAVASLSLRFFRCFERFDLSLAPQITLITGANGSGKTSLIEAIHVASNLRSFRTPTIRDLIMQGQEAFSLKLQLEADMIHVAYGAQQRSAELNNKSVTRRELLHLFPVVTITEHDIDMIQGAPELRRAFLDQILAQRNTEYIDTLQRYLQVLQQRNALLAQSRNWHEETYYILTEELKKSSEVIRAARKELAALLEEQSNKLLQRVMSGYGEISLEYLPQKEGESLEQRERKFGYSLCGAHKDDLLMTLKERSARRYASRGMQKLVALLLRIAQAELVNPQLILLDDIMADFDEKRLEAVFEALLIRPRQMLITVPTTGETLLTQLASDRGAARVNL